MHTERQRVRHREKENDKFMRHNLPRILLCFQGVYRAVLAKTLHPTGNQTQCQRPQNHHFLHIIKF